MTRVGLDVLALDALLDTLDPLQRAAVERAIDARVNAPREEELEDEFARGYDTGLAACAERERERLKAAERAGAESAPVIGVELTGLPATEPPPQPPRAA